MQQKTQAFIYFCPLRPTVVTENTPGCRSEKQMFKLIFVREEHFFLHFKSVQYRNGAFLAWRIWCRSPLPNLLPPPTHGSIEQSILYGSLSGSVFLVISNCSCTLPPVEVAALCRNNRINLIGQFRKRRN